MADAAYPEEWELDALLRDGTAVHVRPIRPGTRDRVCFFERSNFRGDSFCARPGERLARLGRWDEEISSIQIFGDAQALVCERTNFNGRCIVISRSARNLGAADDRIRSIRVR